MFPHINSYNSPSNLAACECCYLITLQKRVIDLKKKIYDLLVGVTGLEANLPASRCDILFLNQY